MFEDMISKKLIEWLWVLLSIGILITAYGSFSDIRSPGVGDAVIHLLGAGIGLIIVRVVCEGMIVIFSINDNLRRSRSVLEQILERQRDFAGGYSQRGGNSDRQEEKPVTVRTTVSTLEDAPPTPSDSAWESGQRLRSPRVITSFEGAYAKPGNSPAEQSQD